MEINIFTITTTTSTTTDKSSKDLTIFKIVLSASLPSLAPISAYLFFSLHRDTYNYVCVYTQYIQSLKCYTYRKLGSFSLFNQEIED